MLKHIILACHEIWILHPCSTVYSPTSKFLLLQNIHDVIYGWSLKFIKHGKYIQNMICKYLNCAIHDFAIRKTEISDQIMTFLCKAFNVDFRFEFGT